MRTLIRNAAHAVAQSSCCHGPGMHIEKKMVGEMSCRAQAQTQGTQTDADGFATVDESESCAIRCVPAITHLIRIDVLQRAAQCIRLCTHPPSRLDSHRDDHRVPPLRSGLPCVPAGHFKDGLVGRSASAPHAKVDSDVDGQS